MATEVLTETAQASIPLATSQQTESEKKGRFSGSQDVGFTNPETPAFKNKYEERDWIKGRLAAAYRIFGHFGLNEGAAGHITVRDPVEPDTFWVNPFGVDFNLINKSDLLRVDHKGNILDHGRVKVLNKAAFLIHGSIHAARPDVLCAAHTHSVHGRAFCALGRPLDMLTLESCIFYDVSGLVSPKLILIVADNSILGSSRL